jgi:hypothetical protein
MSRQDYNAIANEINNQVAMASDINTSLDIVNALRAVADRLAIPFATNPRFDRNRFINACGF